MHVLVIGAGAAGSMAAISAAQSGADVTLIEKNEKIGKKIYITGKGRCNVTNAADLEVVFKNVNRNPKFLYSALYGFTNTDVCDFFEKNGCRLKTERGDRVFPVSDHASDIIKALNKALNDLNVKIMLNTTVKAIVEHEKVAAGVLLTDGTKIFADRIIIATGGISYPTTGSTGDGYRFAEFLGHSVVKPRASLSAFYIQEPWVKRLQGLSLKNVELRLICNGKEKYRELGEMLFTHMGVSGPLCLSASAFYDEELKDKPQKLILDLKPGLTYEQLDKRILRDFEGKMNRQFKNSLDELLPRTMIQEIVDLSGIDGEKAVNEVSRNERLNLVNWIKNLTMTPVSLAPVSEAIVTRGGVNVKEINASTMESKIVKNLYFAGEVLDIDAMTGGFNLQLAWSTGHLAGSINQEEI